MTFGNVEEKKKPLITDLEAFVTFCYQLGGEGGIRTLGTVSRTSV
jgi:hypothetical protein